jgi:hypothetical protein
MQILELLFQLLNTEDEIINNLKYEKHTNSVDSYNGR